MSEAESLPPRGAWIEILGNGGADTLLFGRSPHGERGLKYEFQVEALSHRQVAPPTGSVD